MPTSFTTTHSQPDTHAPGFQVRDMVRFFIVDIILIIAVRLLLALGMFPTMDAYVLTLLGSKVVLFAYLIWLVRDKRNAWPQTGGATLGRWWVWPVCILMYCAYLPLSFLIEAGNGYFMTQLHAWLGWVYAPKPQEVVVLIFENILAWPSRLLLVFFTVLAGPFTEELAFRGMGLDAYKRESGPAWAVFMTSILFGAYHFSLQYLFPLAVLGGIFALVRLFSRTLWCSVFVHCLHNGLALALTAHNLEIIDLQLL